VHKNIKFVSVFIYLVCSLLSANAFVFAQPPDEVCEPKFRHNMFSVHLADAREGWACGDAGMIYHTIDGGFKWETQPVDTTEALFGISFANAKVGWVVGNKGLIFQTMDGGKTWIQQKSSTGKILFNVEALSADKAIACGDWGTIAYTSDGGETWEDRTYPKDMMMYGIDFVDENEGWIAGEFGGILHTTDSGVTWQVQATGVENMLYSISFSTNLEGLAGGIDGLILKTVDGGNTWQKVEFMTEEEKNLKSMQQSAAGEANNIYRQEDFIKQMTQRPPIFEVGLLGNIGIAAGDEGVLMISSDTGSTWEKLTLPPDLSLLWFRGISLVKNEDKITGATIGAKAVCIISENNQLNAVGFMPEVTVCQKP
jgi:photosystem II stability/assembly factor-like uncharacterized protein